MALPCVCYSTNTNEDRNRLQVLSKRLKNITMLQPARPDGQLLDALVATALTDDRAAAHWLVNHAEDPSLASGNPRVYYLLLCPANELETRFEDFWTAYRGARDWSAPMDYMPNVPLVQPFEAHASQLLDVYHAFNIVSRCFADRCPAGDFQLALTPVDLTAKPLKLSLQLCENSVETMLQELAAMFVKMLADASLPVVPARPPYRAALCEGFMQPQQYLIEQEAMHHFVVDPDTRRVAAGTPADTVWQLRLYSRDVRQRNDLTGETHAVYRMRSECLPADDDPAGFVRLAYSAGDLVALVAAAEPCAASIDVAAGPVWALGFNCETGQLGHFRPVILEAQRVPCTSAWTLHKVANLGCTLPSSPLGNSASSSCWAGFSRQSSMCTDECASATGAGCGGSAGSASHCYCGANGAGGSYCSATAAHRFNYAPYAMPPSDTSGSSDSMPPSPKPVGKSKSIASFFLPERPRSQLHVMRHGERMDTTVGFHWFSKAFDKKGVFANRFDLNIPEQLPTRPYEDFDRDTPLTLIGQFVSHQMGEALARAGVRYSYAYSSPALRCVQTAHHLLQGAGQTNLSVRIEPMLNEFPYDDHVQMPNFMTATELRNSGYNVDKDYSPHSSLDGFDRCNTPDKYQHRVRKVFKKILDSTRKRGGNILVVGHRTTLEFCPVIFMGCKAYVKRVCIPYNALMCLDERPKKGSWMLANTPSAAFSFNEHCRFDGSSLTSPV